MQQDIRSLVRQGLYLQNLIRLIEICNTYFDRNPALYGTLYYIFRALGEEYERAPWWGEIGVRLGFPKVASYWFE